MADNDGLFLLLRGVIIRVDIDSYGGGSTLWRGSLSDDSNEPRQRMAKGGAPAHMRCKCSLKSGGSGDRAGLLIPDWMDPL